MPAFNVVMGVCVVAIRPLASTYASVRGGSVYITHHTIVPTSCSSAVCSLACFRVQSACSLGLCSRVAGSDCDGVATAALTLPKKAVLLARVKGNPTLVGLPQADWCEGPSGGNHLSPQPRVRLSAVAPRYGL